MRVTAWLVVILFIGIRPSFWNPGPTVLLLGVIRTCDVVTIGVSLILSANCLRDSTSMSQLVERGREDGPLTLTQRAETGFT